MPPGSFEKQPLVAPHTDPPSSGSSSAKDRLYASIPLCELANTLARVPNITFARLQDIVCACPSAKVIPTQPPNELTSAAAEGSTDPLLKAPIQSTVTSSRVSPPLTRRQQEGLLAVCVYLRSSAGSHRDQLLPILLEGLRRCFVLETSKFRGHRRAPSTGSASSVESFSSILTADNVVGVPVTPIRFTAELVSELGRLADQVSILAPQLTGAVTLACRDVFSEVTQRGQETKPEVLIALSGLVAGLSEPVFPFSHEQATLLLSCLLPLAPRILFGATDERSLGSTGGGSSSDLRPSNLSAAASKLAPKGDDQESTANSSHQSNEQSPPADDAGSADLTSSSKKASHHHRHHTKKRTHGGKQHSKHGSVRSKRGGAASLLGASEHTSASAITSHTTTEQKTIEQVALLNCICNLLHQLEPVLLPASDVTAQKESATSEVGGANSVEQLCRRAHTLATLLVDPQRPVPPSLMMVGVRILRETALKAPGVRLRVSRFLCKFLQHADLDKSAAYAQAEARAQLMQKPAPHQRSSVHLTSPVPANGAHPQKWEICQVALGALQDLCRAHPRRLASAVDAVRTFLLAKLVRIRCADQVVAIPASVCEYVVNALTILIVMQLERETPEASRSLLNSLSNVLYTSYRKYKNSMDKMEKRKRKGNDAASTTATAADLLRNQQNENLLRAVTALLGCLATRVGHLSGATEVVVTPLVRRITESLATPLPLDHLFINELARVACAADQKRDVYQSVADLLINTYRNVLHRDAQGLKHVVSTFPGACLYLAEHLPVGEKLEDFQLRVLRLLQALSLQIQKVAAASAARQPRMSSSSSVTSFFSPTSSGTSSSAMEANTALAAAREQRATLVGTLGSMLPVLATVLRRTNARNTVREDGLRKLCRNVWFFALFFEFVIPDRHPSEWYEAVCSIAVHMPVLYTPKHYTYLETSIEFESYLTPQGSGDSDLSRLRRALSDVLPATSLAPSIRSFSAGQCAHLLCMFYLESLRSAHDPRSSAFQATFSYLARYEIGRGEEKLSACIRGLVDHAFPLYLTAIEAQPVSATRQRELEKTARFLFVRFCHQEAHVRDAADKYIIKLVDRFPALLWNTRCLEMLLELLQVLGNSCEERTSSSSYLLNEVRVGSSRHTLLLPDNLDDRQTMLQSVGNLCKVWLSAALRKAPEHTRSVLQQYLHSFRNVTLGLLRHIGFALAVQMGALGESGSTAIAPAAVGVHRPAVFVDGLHAMGQYTGEVAGMYAVLSGLSTGERGADGPSSSATVQLATRLADQLSSQVGNRAQLVPSSFNAHLYRAAAFLITATPLPDGREPGHGSSSSSTTTTTNNGTTTTTNNGTTTTTNNGTTTTTNNGTTTTTNNGTTHLSPAEAARLRSSVQHLLHMVCWAPVLLFRQDCMMTGTFVWRWLLAARPDLAAHLMAELRDAWAWTVDERLGLFTDHVRPASPLSIPESEDTDEGRAGDDDDDDQDEDADEADEAAESESDQMNGSPVSHPSSSGPHRVFLSFLEQYWTSVVNGSPAERSAVVEMLLKAVADPHHLSCLPLSLGPRFQLLLLGLELLRARALPDVTTEHVFRSRVYRAAAAWFYHPPAWYDPAGLPPSSLYARTGRAAVEQDVHALVEFCRALRADADSVARSAADQHRPAAATPAAAAAGAGAGAGAARDQQAGGTAQEQEEARDAQYGTGVLTVLDPQRARELNDQVGLLLMLVGHEIDRIVTWHNPLNRIRLHFDGQKEFSVACSAYVTAQWARLVKTAWRISPRLAFQLPSRFPYPKLARILEAVVLDHAAEVVDVPEALPFLVTRENVAKNVPALRHLLYWAVVEPPQALALLHSDYLAHPFVTQYAIRVLRSFPPEINLFYLPQLVQALRYHSSSLVSDFLANASKRSEVMGHQLIWNTLTVEQGSGRQEQEFYAKATALRERIIANLSAEARRNYEDEFEFFDAVTSISGTLLPLDAHHRRTRLKEELRRIPVRGNLYLPTNSNTTVISINVNSACPMQSAAKVPILVSFQVLSTPALLQHGSTGSASPSQPMLRRRDTVLAIAGAQRDGLPGSSSQGEEDEQVGEERAEQKQTEEPEEAADDERASSSKRSDSSASREKRRERKQQQQQHREQAASAQSGDEGEPRSFGEDGESSAASSEEAPVDKGKEEAIPEDEAIFRAETGVSPSAPDPIAAAVADSTNNRTSSSSGDAEPAHTAAQLESARPQACIFKVGDDVRQDVLALQVIELSQRIFRHVGLDLYVYPYKVIATAPGYGVIQCVPHAKSRDQLGKQSEGKSLYEYFEYRYGPRTGLAFQRARYKFLQSMAAYSMLSYVLQMKDRHNGNILIDDAGHVVHIDFGFIFDISPGGNLKFERAAFKLSAEMVELMGGNEKAEQFKWFMSETVKAYLALREHSDAIVTLVRLMMDTQLPCFTERTIQNLQSRLSVGKSEREAAEFMSFKVVDSFSGLTSQLSTQLYDRFQSFSNGIDW